MLNAKKMALEELLQILIPLLIENKKEDGLENMQSKIENEPEMQEEENEIPEVNGIMGAEIPKKPKGVELSITKLGAMGAPVSSKDKMENFKKKVKK